MYASRCGKRGGRTRPFRDCDPADDAGDPRRLQMLPPLVTHRSSTQLFGRSQLRRCILPGARPQYQSRTFFGWFKKSKSAEKKDPVPLLTEDNLFHPFSKSPFPAIRARGEAIQKLAPCPVCASEHGPFHAHAPSQPLAVKFECPDCGWPTHCSEEHWRQDEEHKKYCGRLREVNEDEHDLRSGRRFREFELPGQDMSTFRCRTRLLILCYYRPSGL